MSPTRALCIVVAVGAVVTACGDDGPERVAPAGTPEHPRVIQIEMVDIGFEPSEVDVSVGETVEFVFVNEGAVRHEAVFGDEQLQEDHELEMQEMGGMAMDHEGGMADEDAATNHDDESAATDHDDSAAMDHDDEGVVALSVEPGAEKRVVMSFDEAGHTLIGCHEDGHWTAGMRVDIAVA